MISGQPHHCNRETIERTERGWIQYHGRKGRTQAQVSVDIVFIIYKVYYLSQESWGAYWEVWHTVEDHHEYDGLDTTVTMKGNTTLQGKVEMGKS